MLSFMTLLLVIHASIVLVAHGDYTMAVSGRSVSVTITTVFRQNVTLNPLPAHNITLFGSNVTSAESAFTSALGSLVPGVSVSNLQLNSDSSGNTTLAKVSFSLGGATILSGGVLKFNMAWKSFTVTDDIDAGGASINSVGKYLATSPLLDRTSSSLIAWGYFEDGKPIPSTQSVSTATSFYMFDFSQLSAPLSSWPIRFSQDESGHTLLSSGENHNFTIREATNEPGGQFIDYFIAGYSHKILITVPGFATVEGDTVISDAGSLMTGAFFALSIVFPAVGLAAYLVEQRIGRTRRPGRINRGRRRPKP